MLNSVRRFSNHIFARRLSSAQLPVRVSDEIIHALHENVPVVALESTIITHGFPYPANLDMARAVESKIRENGCVPATCAFIKGVPYVGLSDSQIEMLAELKNANKVSRRDIGPTMAQGLNGGTTIAGTMILSHIAGIRVFATGGLGGVHRDGHITMDISADLTELSRTPVTVVCAGPKSILDIPRTMEFLETQGVLVATYNDNKRTSVDVPGFFCRSSGVASPYSFASWREIANIIHNQNSIMGLSSGSLVCVPPPADTSLDSDFIEEVILRANDEAVRRGISGKALTPFLLSRIATETGGKSVECNKHFVINNADAACKIASELCLLPPTHRNASFKKRPCSFRPSTGLESAPEVTTQMGMPQIDKSPERSSESTAVETTSSKAPNNVDVLIIGSVALDTICTFDKKPVWNDSNPGKMNSSIGGVGYNVSLALGYSLASLNSRATYRFVSVTGSDAAAGSITQKMEQNGMDCSGILSATGLATAQYTANLTPQGELLLAAADMGIFEDDSIAEHLATQIKRAEPEVVIVDCNLSPQNLSKVLNTSKDLLKKPRVILEPTSSPKSSRLSQVDRNLLQVFPNNHISLITPTVKELEQLYASFVERELLDDLDAWFPALDSLGLDGTFREKLNAAGSKNPVFKELVKNGVFQQAFCLLPYVPNILVKLGAYGCVYVKLSTSADDYKSIPTTSKFKPTTTVVSRGKTHDGGKVFGVVVEHYGLPEENRSIPIVNVTGAGDSLLGYICATLVHNDWLGSEVSSLEQEWGKWEAIYKAQVASGRTLQSADAVSREIRSM